MKFRKVGQWYDKALSIGRYAGKKVVIIEPNPNCSKKRPSPHAIVAGIECGAQNVTLRMGKTCETKRSKVKRFIIAVINHHHLAPTRYTPELEGLTRVVTTETFTEISHQEDAKENVKKTLEE